ncbi:hypothetical protein BDM02DRAFT_1948733 [Thelephora ganbajun]|uniref:Uncharacterized protein n=1 Tax=Thelephora ganbajun TaxID=370292 RepID=A0ACB6ZI67_THEGA|nr:hypothetical protein BDM02DRAFT_1948733 [Thelephora ganbajun]
MSDPEGGLKELATSSRVDGKTTLIDLPPELILRIASLLEVRDLLAFRRTHRFIHTISQDKLLWGSIFHDLRLPLPRTLRSRHLDSLSYPELENAVLHSCMVEHWWLKERKAVFTLPAMNSSYRLLDFLDDRWVISIPVNGSPVIWDTREIPPKLYQLCESTSHAFRTETSGATVAVDPHQGDIIIGLRKNLRDRSTSQILRVHLADPKADCLQLTAYKTIDHLSHAIIALEPSRNAVITDSISAGIEIGDWIRSRVVGISTPNDYEFAFILGVRLVGDYILSFRSTCIELLSVPPFPDTDGQITYETNPASYRFHLNYPDLAFTGASLSEPQQNPESPEDSRIVYILAHQTTIGFFYFRVTIYNPDYVPSGPRARMDVDLLGVYELRRPRVRHREEVGTRLVLGGRLGPEGKRGLWTERSLSKLKRFVVAASFDQSCSEAVAVESGDDLRELCEIAPRIESTSDVFVVDSWSPDDDIVRCAFSEATGKIVLGTRDNRIILL